MTQNFWLRLFGRNKGILQPLVNFPVITAGNRMFWCTQQRLEKSGNFKIKVSEVLDDWNTRFFENEISEPRESIENILMHVLNTRKYSEVYKMKNRILSLRELKEINRLANLRLTRMPVQYVIGEWDFRDVNLKMRPPVFIPRPETEQLVEHVLKELQDNKDIKEVLELCCGCGAISLALLKAKSDIKVTTFDKSKEACDLTVENAKWNNLEERLEVKQLNLEDKEGLLTFLGGRKFRLIVGNPPYIAPKDLQDLQPEIKLYEDRDALDGGGEDGLKLIKLILDATSEILADGGKLYLEADPGHPKLLRSWLQENEGLGLQLHATHEDICGQDRYLEIIKKIPQPPANP